MSLCSALAFKWFSTLHRRMYPIPAWPVEKPKWSEETVELLLKDEIPPRHVVPLDEVLKRSEKFPVKFPVYTIQCKHLNKAEKVEASVLERNINSAYPILHEQVLAWCARFILHKKNFGSDIEKGLYKNLSVLGLINRLLCKRAVMFMGRRDMYIVDGERGRGVWGTVGTKHETPPLTLSNYISYDEIKLSAFLSVSSYTHFINSGTRDNCAIPEKDRSLIEKEGIIIGLIGARFEKENVMEYEDVVTTNGQPIEENSTAALFRDFYEEPILSFREISKVEGSRYTNMMYKYFDNVLYAKRLALSFDTLLIEANQRAKDKQTTAFIHMVGIGLGVWKLSSHQKDVFLETFIKRIEILGKNLHSISDVNFAYMRTDKCGRYVDGDKIPVHGHPFGGIKVFLNNREPHLKLTGEHEGKLLVVTYAWDGNALPGNEFWDGSLDGSGDPAAACSTQVAELHNPHINPKVCAENLHVATTEGVIPLLDYTQKLKNETHKSLS